MQVKSVTLKNYRNLAAQTVKLTNGLNVLCGDNAQGKTNFLESVYLCCIGKSQRSDDRDLVAKNQSVAHVKTVYTCRYGEGEIAVGIAGNKKHISVNSVEVKRLGDLLGYLNCIYFSPDDIKIVSQSPAERRKFLDVDLCQTDKNYFYSLNKFNKALAQRNNTLKNFRDEEQLKKTLFIWDEQIAQEGAKIIVKRRNFCEKLKVYAAECHEKLTENKEKTQLRYRTQIEGDDVKTVAENYLAALESNLAKDMQLRYTTIGCQRDDVALVVDGTDVRSFGSQGQQRTCALSLKLAELAIFREINGEYPVLLLDDVLSELDAVRQRQLLSFAKDVQILLTTARPIDKDVEPDNYNLLNVKKGVITQN